MGNQISIADALFSKTQQRVLGLLFGHPERSFYLKEIIDRVNVGRGAVQRELEKLLASGLVTVKPIGSQRHFQANVACPVYPELCSIVIKALGMVDILTEALAPLSKKLQAAFIFGSMASGKATAGSDIDLMVIGDVSFADVVEATFGAQEVLGREINPKVYNKEEWEKMYKENTAFIKELIAKPRLFIVGSDNEPG